LRLHATLPAGTAVPAEGETVTLTFNREQLHLMEEGA
jgi:putative spermidine/putrescine transport system ATP-binding protein